MKQDSRKQTRNIGITRRKKIPGIPSSILLSLWWQWCRGVAVKSVLVQIPVKPVKEDLVFLVLLSFGGCGQSDLSQHVYSVLQGVCSG